MLTRESNGVIVSVMPFEFRCCADQHKQSESMANFVTQGSRSMRLGKLSLQNYMLKCQKIGRSNEAFLDVHTFDTHQSNIMFVHQITLTAGHSHVSTPASKPAGQDIYFHVMKSVRGSGSADSRILQGLGMTHK